MHLEANSNNTLSLGHEAHSDNLEVFLFQNPAHRYSRS